jgi:hypothetical protein
MTPTQRTQRWTSLALIVVVLILLSIVGSIALVSLTYHHMVLGGEWAMSSDWLKGVDVQTRAAALGQLGDYFGGTLNPILSFCGFLVLLVTVVLQRRQLEEGTRQLAQSTRAIDLEAFVRVNDMLQSPDGLAARARLQQLLLRRGMGAGVPSPDTWSPQEHQAAQTVVRQFDLVALLIEGRLFDPNLFLRSWQHDISLCWQACEAQVQEQRAQLQNPAYGRRFEELHRLAQGCRATVRRQLGYEPVGPDATASLSPTGSDLVRPSA